jgi:hypothetical protein
MILRKATLAAWSTCVCAALGSLHLAAATGATPFGGTVVELPGTIEAENFDDAGASIGYFDTSAGNRGGEYRQTDVDIEATSDIGRGYDVGWTRPGEWLQYTVNVSATTTYAVELRLASISTGATLRVEVDGVDMTGPLTVPNTGGWQTWTTIRKDGIVLQSGQRRIRLAFLTAGTDGIANVNFLRVVPSTIVPSPWSSRDIGQPSPAGSASFANNAYTVSGAGADIWGTTDAFQFVSQPAAGDTQIVARVTSVQNTNMSAKAAVMLRESTASDAAHVILDVGPSGNVEFMTRRSKGAPTTYLAGTQVTVPTWLKLSRTGATLVGSVSADGRTWKQIGTTTATATLGLVGMAVNSHSTALNTSVFDNVTVGAPPVVLPPAPTELALVAPSNATTGVAVNASFSWSASGATSYDVKFGTTNPPPVVATALASATYAPASFANSTTYYWQVTARNPGGTTSSAVWSFTTIAVPPSVPTAGSPADAARGVARTALLTWSAAGATSYNVRLGTTNPPVAASGVTAASYTPVGLLPATTYYWQITAINEGGATGGSVWSFTTGGLPVPWTSLDIGAVGLSGGASYDGGTFTVVGGGADIWGTADAFQFVSQAVSGDTQIVARVLSLQNTYAKAKAGVMLRESNAPDAAHVTLDVKPTGGTEFLMRTAAGALSAKLGTNGNGAPAYVRLTRSGSTVTGAVSTDGTTWTTVATATFNASTLLAGLIVNSHDVRLLNTATFDNVAISVPPSASPAPDPTPAPAHTVPAGGDVQAALDAAPAGATVYLTAGATYTQNVVFRQRGSVTLTTQGFAVPAGTRVAPSDAPTMAKIVCSDCFSPTIGFEFGSHDVNVVGVEVIGNPSHPDRPTINIGNHPVSWAPATTVAAQPSNITFDRVYVHAESTGGRQGILADGVNIKVLNSYISGFWLSGQDSQAVGMIQGAGPVLVQNNYLEASGENMLVGGSDPTITGMIPADITVKDNYFFKPLSWKTAHPGSVKNLFELKNAQRVLVDHNVFENVWVDGQAGSAILFTIRNQGGECTWCVVKDVTFTNNVVKNVANFAFSILGTDDNYPSGVASNLVIKNNLILDSNNGVLIQSPLNATELSHNTFVNIKGKFLALGNITTGSVVNGFIFRDNALQAGSYGITGNGTAPGMPSLDGQVAAGYTFRNNIIEQSSERYIAFPSGNYVIAPGTYASTMNAQYAIIDASCVATEGGSVLVGADVTKLPQ